MPSPISGLAESSIFTRNPAHWQLVEYFLSVKYEDRENSIRALAAFQSRPPDTRIELLA
jgi:hypothetical protein